MNALEFFQHSAGQWRSQRTTHHLALRRAETGSSIITVEPLGPTDRRIAEICQFHGVEAQLALGGAYITWRGTMEWDRAEEAHQGASIFALVPDGAEQSGESDPSNPSDVQAGRLLRDQGYGEKMPVVGRYHLEAGDRLVLTTDYETLSAVEQFWFVSPNLRVRWSAVKRLGGFVTSSFCTESRLDPALQSPASQSPASQSLESQSLESQFLASQSSDPQPDLQPPALQPLSPSDSLSAASSLKIPDLPLIFGW
ncbi:MAG: phycobiliprotein lyase [Prochlorothrix sp.]|nr:phycobiliprotein lyase [Prochlorothrix sp.]